MIDWSKLKPYQNDKYRSFEELCYQIAKGLYGENGLFTSVDDSGGGDGVEFYLTLPNGNERSQKLMKVIRWRHKMYWLSSESWQRNMRVQQGRATASAWMIIPSWSIRFSRTL